MSGIYSNMKRHTYTETFSEICHMGMVSVKKARSKVLSAAKKAAKYSDTIRINTPPNEFSRKTKMQTFYNVCNELANNTKGDGLYKDRHLNEVALIALVASKCTRKQYHPGDDGVPMNGSTISLYEKSYNIIRHEWNGLRKEIPFSPYIFNNGPFRPIPTNLVLFGSSDPMQNITAPDFSISLYREEFWYEGVPILRILSDDPSCSYMRRRLQLVNTVFDESNGTTTMKAFTTQCALRLR